jgi:hypothetical protein
MSYQNGTTAQSQSKASSRVLARYGDRNGHGAERVSQRSGICSVAWSGAATEFNRRQKSIGRVTDIYDGC